MLKADLEDKIARLEYDLTEANISFKKFDTGTKTLHDLLGVKVSIL